MKMDIGEEELEIKWDVDSACLDWAAIFGNNNPVEIEVGIGKGRFLINSALSNPDVNYLGIEWAKKYITIARHRAAMCELNNIRLLKENASQVIERGIPAESISHYHIYFPDPWPKKRHHKRRLFQKVVVDKIAETLVTGGKMSIVTDYHEYYEWILEALSENDRIQPISDGGVIEAVYGNYGSIPYGFS